ncbi:MAG: hypothetical protein V1809_02175 [Planctomycetota bacterium]
MVLSESYVAYLENIPKKNRIFVMRNRGHNNLAPSVELLHAFKQKEFALKQAGMSGIEAHNAAWEAVRYEDRFIAAFWSNPSAVEELRSIKTRSLSEDVYLICYEKPPKKCHRHLLLSIARNL